MIANRLVVDGKVAIVDYNRSTILADQSWLKLSKGESYVQQ